MNAERVFVAWTEYQRRQESMVPTFGFTLMYFGRARGQGIRKALSYALLVLRTWRALRKSEAKEVWVQLPPTFALWGALLYKWTSFANVKIVGDCHNAMFRPPWSSLLGFRLLNRASLVIAHNRQVRDVAEVLGISSSKLMVLEDAPAIIEVDEALCNEVLPVLPPRPWFLFPASFSKDEPIAELVRAARQCPDVSILITGRPKTQEHRALIENAPGNVTFLGFLSKEIFEAYMCRCDVVVALTTLMDVQLSACNEAVGLAKPMLTSDTPALRGIFNGSGAVFVHSSDSDAIASAICGMKDDLSSVREEMSEFQVRRWNDWTDNQARPVMARLRS